MGNRVPSGRPLQGCPRVGIYATVGRVWTMGARQISQLYYIPNLRYRQHFIVDAEVINQARVYPVIFIVSKSNFDIKVLYRVDWVRVSICPGVILSIQVKCNTALIGRVLTYRYRDMVPLAGGQCSIILGIAAARFDAHPVVTTVEPNFHSVTGAAAAPADNFTVTTNGTFLPNPHSYAESRCVSAVTNNPLVAVYYNIIAIAIKLQGLT